MRFREVPIGKLFIIPKQNGVFFKMEGQNASYVFNHKSGTTFHITELIVDPFYRTDFEIDVDQSL